jgi:ELWxxDGT repeat protein
MLKLPEAVWSRSLSIVFLLACLAAAAGAQPATQVINLQPDFGAGASSLSSFPHGFMALPGKLIFQTGNVRSSNAQYAVSDGTSPGTRLLPNAPRRGECFSVLPEIGTAGNVAFWIQCIDFTLAEVWRSDGTAAGTFAVTSGESVFFLLSGQFPGNLPEDPDYAIAGGILYFLGCAPDLTTCTLWRTDGSLAGTHAVDPSKPAAGAMIGLGNRLLFATFKDGHTYLAVTDGTAAGTLKLQTFDEQSPRRFAVAGGKAFFLAGQSNEELWVSDGTAAGTRAVTSFGLPDTFAATNWLAAIGNHVYFQADDVVHGSEFWRSDGTAAGTVRITDFGFHAPFDESMRPSHLAETTGGRVVFLATDDLQDVKLWSTNGTPESTTLLTTVCHEECRDFVLGRGFDSQIELVRVASGRVVFTRHGSNGLEAWSTDGTAAGTFQLTDQVQSRPSALQGAVFFGAHAQLWTSDGTLAGTRAFSDLPAGTLVDTSQQDVGMIAGKVLFPAVSPLYGSELWTSTGQAGSTELLGDLAHAAGAGSIPRQLTPLGEHLLFLANTNTTTGLWSSGGTAATTLPIPVTRGCPQASISELFRAGITVYFHASGDFCQDTLWTTDGVTAAKLLDAAPTEEVEFQSQLFYTLFDHSGHALWKSNGTPGGTVKAFDFPSTVFGIRDLTAVGPELYFLATDNSGSGYQVWRSDGTLAGTQQLTAWENASVAGQFVRAGPFVYFLGPDRTFPHLWRTDGTPGGTIDLLPNDFRNDVVQDLAAFHGALFFFRRGNGTDVLYRSDGTPEGTVPVHSFNLDFLDNQSPHDPTLLGDQMLFVVDDDTHGLELWKTDGTDAGTTLVRDVFPGITSSRPYGLTLAGGRVFFGAQDATHGVELWQTDGTEAGTRMVQDINPELASSNPFGFTVFGDRLFFDADDGVTGQELWSLPLAATAPCQPAADHLCLNGGRYRVDADWTANGMSGAGTAVPLSADTGYFWFFSPANVETVLKVLDGRSLNGHVWVFYGALSNVEYNLTVTDTQTGIARRYFNPRGQFASVGDTQAFGPLGAYESNFIAAPSAPPQTAERIDLTAATGTCVPAAGRLCLNNGRFAVEAAWKDFANHTGTGTAVSLTGDTGYFWFFDPSNVEAVLKVLDATSFNGHFWVYYGALSNVEYTLTVTDTMTGHVKTYQNPLGRFASAGDTLAF